MKRKFVQIAALCLSAALLLVSAGGQMVTAAPANSNDRIIRVGLHYGTGTMEGLNFLNDVGSGYSFGYYNSANQFVALGSTSQKTISVVPTVNVYYGTYSGYTSYHTALTSSAVAVGEYHLQLAGTYSTFDAAQAAASAYTDGFPAYIGGVFYARIGSYTTRDKAVAAQSALAAQGVSTTLAGTTAYGVNAVITGTNTILFQYDDNGSGTGMGIEPVSVNGEKCATWSKDRLYNGGFRFERINGGMLTVVNILGLEDYVKGVVPNEMSNSWPMEALKAQAVAARSYVLSLGTKHGSHHFDVCFDTDCQAYYGRAKAGANSDGAVDQTAGQVVLYNGKAAHTSYYSSNGGCSESSSTVWGSNQANYPYLVGRADPYETVSDDYTASFTSATLAAKLKAKGYDVGGGIVSIAVTALTDSGNPKTVTFVGTNGKSYSLNSRAVVGMLGLRSYRYGFSAAAIPQPSSTPTTSGSLSINGTATVSGTTGLYAIDGSGNVTAVGGDAYIITESGTIQAGQAASGGAVAGDGSLGSLSSTTGQNETFTFVGRGWGHNVGMSQFGASAMAKIGYTYIEILQFYYTGITVGYM